MTSNYPTLSVIMPVYNEVGTVEECLKRVLDSPYIKEVIMVDDGSTDGSKHVLSKIKDKRVRVFHHPENFGKGAAIKTALPQTSGQYIIIQDSDLEYDPQDFDKLLEPVKNGLAEVVYGSRFMGKVRHRYYLHSLANYFLSLTTNILYGTSLTDMETCYKLIKRDLIINIPLKSRRFEFEPEVTTKLLKKGIRIHEVPISYKGRDYKGGKKITWTDGLVAVWTLIKYRFVD